MALAIFDLDNTLLGGDSDHAWGQFMVEQELVDAEAYAEANDRFYQDYQQGRLDIESYLTFALAPLAERSMAELDVLHRQFMIEKIEPMMLPAAEQLIDNHRRQGDMLMVITSTNSFVATPISRALGIEHCLCSQAEIRNSRYTGRSLSPPCFREHKITHLNRWLEQHQQTLQGSYGYSDSINDLPLLQAVDKPVVVDGDIALLAHARSQGWPCISLRE